MTPSNMPPSPYADPTNYKDIVRGCLYWATVPFQPAEPVEVFHPHHRDSKVGIVGADPSVFHKGDAHPAVVPFKKRPVLVVQENRANSYEFVPYTVVALCYSFDEDKQKAAFYDQCSRWGHPLFGYLSAGLASSKDGYVNLGNLVMLHKSMLSERITASPPFTGAQLAHINRGLSMVLGLGTPAASAGHSGGLLGPSLSAGDQPGSYPAQGPQSFVRGTGASAPFFWATLFAGRKNEEECEMRKALAWLMVGAGLLLVHGPILPMSAILRRWV